MRLKLEPLKNAMQLSDVICVFGADEKVQVDKASLGGDI